MKKNQSILTAAVFAVLLLSIGGIASVIVLDPTNLIVNAEQVTHHVSLIARLDGQIRNQIQMLQNWDFTRLVELLASMQRVSASTEGVAGLDLAGEYSISPGAYTDRDAEAMRDLRRGWIASRRQAVRQTQATQESVIAEMPATQQRVGEYVEQARIAPGQTAVLQASNETLATLTAQVQSLQALELTAIRIELEEVARQQALATFQRQRLDVLMRDWGTTAASRPVRYPFARIR